MLRRQHLPIFASVLVLHGLALWAMQSGLLQRAMNDVETAVVLAEVLLPTPLPVLRSPVPDKPAAAARLVPAPEPPPRPEPKAASPQPALPSPVSSPLSSTLPSLAPAPASAPLSQQASVATAPSPATASPGPAQSAASSQPAAKIELPSSDAQYLQNPKPSYPALSRRLNEQGKVVVRVLIGADGQAQKGDIGQSSGYERLDQAALKTVMSWRYVPGKRAGVPEAMWFNVPIHFVLE